jgi:hypothetical protein
MKMIFMLFLPVICFGQSVKLDKACKAAMLKPAYTIDASNHLVFEKIIAIDSVSMDDLFSRAEEYFTYSYGSGDAVIQVNDRATGRLVGKGYFETTDYVLGMPVLGVDTWHVLRLEAKAGRVRVTISLTEYGEYNSSAGRSSYTDRFLITSVYPFTKYGTNKGTYGRAFLEAIEWAPKAFGVIEARLRKDTKDW